MLLREAEVDEVAEPLVVGDPELERKILARVMLLDEPKDATTFTPSGTHAVHLGLLGLVRGSRRSDGVVHSAVEHSAVRHAVAWGARGVEVGVMGDGRVRDGDLVQEAVAPGVAVVALQSANHEVGTLQDVGAFELPDDVPLFTDA